MDSNLKSFYADGHRDIFVVPPGIGDGIMADAVARAYHRQFGLPMLIGHCFPELFENNPDVICLQDFAYYAVNQKIIDFARRVGLTVKSLHYCDFRLFFAGRWLFFYPARPLIEMMAEQAGIAGECELRPRIYLRADERRAGRLFASRQISIMSTGRDNYKSYPVEKIQQIVDAFSDYNFVQLGDKNDPPLRGVRNLQGKLTLRQSAAVLAGSDLFVGMVGALMHMARAVDLPSVILCPSCEPGNIMHYPEFVNINADAGCARCIAEHIAPGCCGVPERCTGDVAVEKVILAMHKALDIGCHSLSARTVTVTPRPVKGMEMRTRRESAAMFPVRAYYGDTAQHFLRGQCLTRWLVCGDLAYEVVFDLPLEARHQHFLCLEFEKKLNLGLLFAGLKLEGANGQIVCHLNGDQIVADLRIANGCIAGDGRVDARWLSDGIVIFVPRVDGAVKLRIEFKILPPRHVSDRGAFGKWCCNCGFRLGRMLKKLCFR